MELRNERHWIDENYYQIITKHDWQQILLQGIDTLIFQGKLRHLKAKNLGVGIYEISKKPLDE